MKKAWLIFLVALIMALLCSCKGKEEDPYKDYRTDTSFSGGSGFEGANVSHLSVEKAGEDTEVFIDFLQGSKRSDGSEEQEAPSVPSYTVSFLPSPARLVISFDQVSYWDYERELDFEGSELIYGSFRESYLNDPGFRIYLQLSKDVSFYVSEENKRLKISLHPLTEEDEEKVEYFAVTNAYLEYLSGTVSREYAIKPVLCRDFSNVVLMSNAFETQEEAYAFIEEAARAQGGILKERFGVVALYHNDLPIFDPSLDQGEVKNIRVIRKDGEEQTLEVFNPLGIYLCDTMDGSGYLYSRGFSALEGDEVSYHEEIWISQPNGQEKRFVTFEFISIEKALLSADGRRLAVLEQAGEGSHLNVFDTDTGELTADLSMVGSNISDFVWDDIGTTLYILGGDSRLEIHGYDFTVTEESKRHTEIDKSGADEGSFSYRDGEVYFVKSDGQNSSKIYRIKPEGGVKREFLEGSSFLFSPSKRYIAYSTAGLEAGVGAGKLFIRDLTTNRTTVVENGFLVHDYLWSYDSKSLYYFENTKSADEDTISEEEQISEEGEGEGEGEESAEEAPQQDPFSYRLYRYDLDTGEKTVVMELLSPSMVQAKDGFYILYDETKESGFRVRATFFFSVS